MSCEDQSKPNLINNKKALFFPTAFLRKPNSADQQHTDFSITTNFLKYFPKFLSKLQIDVHTGPVISKVKRAKIIHAFRGYQNESQSRNLRRTLLYNKEKHIQSIIDESYPVFQYTKRFQQEVRAFTGLKTLKLPQIYTKGNLTEGEQLLSLRKICRSLKTLHKLRHLELQINLESYLTMIPRINKWERLLESLKVLKVECKWEMEDDHSLSAGLLKLKNILKYTTHLKLGCLQNPTFYELFENTLVCCPNLVSLWFETAKEDPDDSSDDENETAQNYHVPVESQYLTALESLSNLQTTNITCRDIWTFLRDFTLPNSVQNVKLQFKSFDASMFFENSPNNSDLPEILQTFCDNWSHLTNLEVLKIIFLQDLDPQSFTLQFLQFWLKRVKNIHNLYVELSSDSTQSLWGEIPKQGNFDFSVFLESIEHLKYSLEILTISDKGLLYSMENLPDQPFNLICLSEIALIGFLPEEFHAFRLFKTNLRNLITIETEQLLKIVLEGLKFDSSDSLLEFIKNFDQEVWTNRSIKIEFEANLRPEPSEIFEYDIESFNLSSQNLSIDLLVNCKESFLSDDVVRSLQEGLQVLKLSY